MGRAECISTHAELAFFKCCFVFLCYFLINIMKHLREFPDSTYADPLRVSDAQQRWTGGLRVKIRSSMTSI